MLFSRALIIESPLPPAITRARVRACAASRDVLDLATFRRRPIVGWRLSEAKESFLFQPEYGDTLDVEGARFVGLVEPLGAGSRIRGRVVVSPLTRIVVSVWMLAVAVATVVALGQGQEPPVKVLAISALMFTAAAFMLRYSLGATSRVVEARFRQSMDGSLGRAVA